MSLTTLFTHLKIILLQYFQFSVTNGIQTNHNSQKGWALDEKDYRHIDPSS